MAVNIDSFVATEMKPAFQKRSREKADRMLKAGHLLVEKQGYDGMRIGDIAKEAGCSVGIFYERFGDKENFFKLMLDASIGKGIEDIGGYLAPERWDGVPTHLIIAKTVYQIVKWFRSHKGLYCAALTALPQTEQNSRPFRHSSRETSALLTTLLETRRAELGCADIEASVRFSLQMINGAMVLAALTELASGSEKRAENTENTENNETLMTDDPELVVQLTRSTCAYLGISLNEAAQNAGGESGI